MVKSGLKVRQGFVFVSGETTWPPAVRSRLIYSRTFVLCCYSFVYRCVTFVDRSEWTDKNLSEMTGRGKVPSVFHVAIHGCFACPLCWRSCFDVRHCSPLGFFSTVIRLFGARFFGKTKLFSDCWALILRFRASWSLLSSCFDIWCYFLLRFFFMLLVEFRRRLWC